MISNQLKNQHLLWRAGFGPAAEVGKELQTASPHSYLKALVKASLPTPETIQVARNMLTGLVMMPGDQDRTKINELSEEQKRQFRKQSEQDVRSLNLAWINQMINSGAQLREKLSLFWHGHFASRNFNIFFQQILLDVIRRNAMGHFGDLLREVSKSAAMLNFLNNNQNKKDHPNENFAREVMELFTMGRGHYTEQDVKEAARAFTGWGANPDGQFVFRKNQHDDGLKTILGKTGNFDGDDVLSILLEQKQTARFIAAKIYRYFVNDEIDEGKLALLEKFFYQSNYDIGSLMQDIFSSDWFYESQNIGSRIKSPVELIVGIRRMLPMKIQNEEVQLLIQRVLGQLLFYPPNVAGWPGGTNWIDSSTLMFRLRIPQIIYQADEFQMTPKDDDDQMMGTGDRNETEQSWRAKERPKQMIRAEIFWDQYLKKFDNCSQDQLVAAVSGFLMQTKEGVSDQVLMRYATVGSRENLIKSLTIQLMSTPEYQLC